ncbi:MAG: hypothetical protein IPK72_19540 [Candidatus Eisenbacteria bacterium]|nr:hypothetical protein [Candidatus Eisenbacteria bacterium]
MYMDAGHLCVRVELTEGPQYADVGYAAPIFRAYPLFESFTLETHRESFDYRVDGAAIQVTRNPGPTKVLDPTPRRLADLQPLITAANDWTVPSSFLRRLVYARDVDGVYTTLRDGVLTRYVGASPETVELSADQIPAALADVFHADPDLYLEAVAVQRRQEPDPRLEC